MHSTHERAIRSSAHAVAEERSRLGAEHAEDGSEVEARRRVTGAALELLVDSILPSVPLRQHVLAFPYDVSALPRRDPTC